MHLLEVPAVFAAVDVEGDDRRREEVVAGAHGAVEIGPRVTRREENEPERGVDRGRVPYGAAAVLPDLVVLWPRLCPALAAARDRVERPNERAVARVERLDTAAHPVLGAREARDHAAVVVERGARDREAVLPALGLHGPRERPRFRVERDDLAVELAHEDAAFAVRDAAIGPAAAHDVVR